MIKMIQRIFPWFVIVSIFIFDQLTKMYIIKNLNLYERVQVLGDFLRFRFVYNTGMAFGIGSELDKGTKDVVFTTLTVLVIILVFYFYKTVRNDQHLAKLGFALIIGGAFGNISDKIFGYVIFHQEMKLFYSAVIDFIDIGIGKYRWPVFNVADIFITLGTVLLVVLILYRKEEIIFKSKKISLKNESPKNESPKNENPS